MLNRWIVCGMLAWAASNASALADETELDSWLQAAMTKSGFPSLAVGVVRGDEAVYHKAFGLADQQKQRAATPDTLYRIGSVSKVFTTSLMVILRDREVLRLDDPIDKFLRVDGKLPSDPRGAPQITLRHLATHTSGLPRQPVNLTPKGDDPYGGFDATSLIQGLAGTRLDSPIGANCAYSNLGVGLLGHCLERAANASYDELLRKHLFEPLEMKSSAVRLPAALQKQFAVGYEELDATKPAPDWDLGVLAPAGGIASSVNDLLKFLALQLRAGSADSRVISGGSLTELHTPQRMLKGWVTGVGLGWHVTNQKPQGEVVWHNGGMAGYHSYVGFSAKNKIGVVVLTNRGLSVDHIGIELLERAVKLYADTRAVQQNAVDPQLRSTADALSKYIVESPADTLGDLFHEEFKKQIPVPAIRAVLTRMVKAHGGCTGVNSIEAGESDRQAIVYFGFGDGSKVKCLLEIDAATPPKVVTLYFPPG